MKRPDVWPQPGPVRVSFLGRAAVDLQVIPSRVATGASFDIAVRNKTPLTLTTGRRYRLQRNTGSWTDVAFPENWMWTLEQIALPGRQVWIQQTRLPPNAAPGVHRIIKALHLGDRPATLFASATFEVVGGDTLMTAP